jgi:hypothetical protein
VEALEQSPVPTDGQTHSIVGQGGGPVSGEHADRLTLVDDQHGLGRSGRAVAIGVVAGAQRISVGDLGEISGELLRQVALHEAQQRLPTLGREPGVTGAAALAPVLNEPVRDGRLDPSTHLLRALEIQRSAWTRGETGLGG